MVIYYNKLNNISGIATFHILGICQHIWCSCSHIYMGIYISNILPQFKHILTKMELYIYKYINIGYTYNLTYMQYNVTYICENVCKIYVFRYEQMHCVMHVWIYILYIYIYIYIYIYTYTRVCVYVYIYVTICYYCVETRSVEMKEIQKQSLLINTGEHREARSHTHSTGTFRHITADKRS